MGYKYEVHVYMATPQGTYIYVLQYNGNSLINAIRVMYRARRLGGLVRLEWRP